MFCAQRYEQIIAEAKAAEVAQSSQRLAQLQSPAIRLLLVSKYQSRKAVYGALDYFAAKLQRPPNLGENYVQGAAQRAQQLAQYRGRTTQLEMIGTLQSNKVVKAVELFSTLHSVANTKLLYLLEKNLKSRFRQPEKSVNASFQERRLDIFLQYNTSADEQKNGFRSYEQLRHLVNELLTHSEHLCLRGLMCLAAAGSGQTARRRAFASCRQLAERLWCDFPPSQTGGRLAKYFELSMGMSQDYREALAEGSNVLRLGNLLFSG